MPTLPLPLLLLLLFLLPFHVISQPSTTQNDQTTLLNLKHFWSNPPSLNHWNQSSDPCSWPEIICTATTVTGMNITNKDDILGTVPWFICDLKNMTHLDLNYNYLTGAFPKALYNCTNLQYIDLSQNFFVGRILDDISQLSPELRVLSLFGNNFRGDIPVSISGLSKLSSLLLHQNLFNGSFPEKIGYLNDLEELNLAFNDFKPSRLPLAFTRLKKLRKFYMTEANLIGELPANLSSMIALELLDLSVNQINGTIPSDLFSLKKLTQVYLCANKLTGGMPDPTEALNMEIVDLSVNSLTGKIPDGFGSLMSLTNLTLMFNQLSGEIPVSIGRLPNLQDFRIFRNNLSGPLPLDFGRYSDLKIFEVSENQFTGTLPENLCSSGKLKGLVVSDNNLSGEIPKLFENCTSLKLFQVYGNKFSGTIPDGLWKVSTLSIMIMSGNSFSGELPHEMGPKLWMLDISNNNFSGELPHELGPNLWMLDISNNRFSGQIPTTVSSWTTLTVFIASYNLLDGEIPENLTALENLQTLWLDGNQFTGGLPETIISWRSLHTLNLSRNQLTGRIPVGLGFLNALEVLDLSRNKLSGRIPSQLGEQFVFLGLCSDKPSLGFNSCRSSKNSVMFVAIIVSIPVILLILSVPMIRYVVVYYRRKKYGLDTKWNVTAFQNLNFTESTVLPHLIENNVIGHSGSGMVYRVPVNRSGDFVAVKKISSKKDLDQRLEKEYLAEVEILSMIRHSNIVKLMGCISCDISKLLVYEYMENRSLDRWLHPKQAPPSRGLNGSVRHVVLDWPTRLRISVGAARGLCYMHHDCVPGVVHRDVKSSNVLLDSEFNAKIADFGLARILAKENELNSMSTLAGSFGYMAPEYAHTTRVNEKVDIYSFGVILLELATGKEATNGDGHSSLAQWAWQQTVGGAPIEDALDNEVKEPMYLNEMTSVFELGLWCTSQLPTNRPSMKEVCRMLLVVTQPQARW